MNDNGNSICKSIRPVCVLVEKDMGVLVADWKNSSIVYFTHSAVFVDAIPVPFLPIRIALMPNGLIAASSSTESKLCIIDMESKQCIRTIEIPNVDAICYHKQSDTLLVGRCLGRDKKGLLDGNGVIEQYCPTSLRLLTRLTNRTASIPNDMILTFDNRLIVSDWFYVTIYEITC